MSKINILIGDISNIVAGKLLIMQNKSYARF